MVRKYNKKGTRTQELDEESINLAIDDVVQGRLSYRKAALKHNIKTSTLASRVKKLRNDRPSRTFYSKFTSHQIFSLEEEARLNDYIINCSKMHFGLTTVQIRKHAYEYAKALNLKYPAKWDENQMAGFEWMCKYRERNSNLSLRKPEKSNAARSFAFNKNAIKKFYTNLAEVLQRHNFAADRIFNFESGVSTVLDTPKSQKQNQGSPCNEVKVFCPKCNTEVPHTAEGIQEDQTKILIANVYHYFEQEYEELKTIYGDLDLTPLSKFGQRTALATGVSETTVLKILKEEEGRNADKLQELPEKRRRASKRSRQTDSSSEEDSSDDNGDDNEQSSNVHEVQTLVVKVESPDYYNEEPEIYVPLAVKVEPSDIELNKELAQTDPIGVDVKTEPRSDVVDNTNETLALNEPAGTKRRARKIPRSDVTATRQHTRGDSSTAAAASSVPLTERLDESRLLGDTEIKVEEIEIHQEGVS